MKELITMIVSLVVILLMFPILLGGVHSTQVDSVSETTAGVITTSGTSATLTLTTSAWQHRAAGISVSGGAGDSPVVSSVSSDGKTVVVTGLATSATRALVAVYEVNALDDYTGMSEFVSLIPFLVIISAVGALIWGAVGIFKG